MRSTNLAKCPRHGVTIAAASATIDNIVNHKTVLKLIRGSQPILNPNLFLKPVSRFQA